MKREMLFFILFIFLFLSCDNTSDNEKENLADYKIAYNVLFDEEKENYEVFVMNPDGTGKKNISNNPGVDWVYYAYEDKIFFVSDRDTAYRNYFLYVMDADGNNVRRISDIRLNDSFLSSRNNGSEVIIYPYREKETNFSIVDLNGNVVREVSPGLSYFADPFFSPDGERIVFRGANKQSKREEGFVDELYIMNLNGGSPEQITHYPENDSTAEWFAYKSGPPIWEPTNNFITYASKQNSNYSIFSIKPDGTELKQVTPDGFNEIYHSWLPGGDYLVYDGSDLNESNYDIYLMSANGSDVRRLTTDSTYEQGPVFVKIKNKN